MKPQTSSKQELITAGPKSTLTRNFSKPHQSTNSMIKKDKAEKLLADEIRVQEAIKAAKKATNKPELPGKPTR